MILKQYYDLVKSFILNKSITIYPNGQAATSVVLISGSDAWDDVGYTLCLRHNFERCTSSTSTNGKILFGSGITPVSENDVWLENQLTTGISTSITKTVVNDEIVTKYLTITNTSDSDIVIGEVGYASYHVYVSSTNRPSICLLDRTVLAEPITIPPGGVGRIEYSMDFNQVI